MPSPPPLNRDLALYFRNLLRDARLRVLRDAEDYHDLLNTIELLGAAAKGSVSTLKGYRPHLLQIANSSAIYELAKYDRSGRYTSPERLYELLQDARNDAMHYGAYARLLARHAVEFTLLLEDALVNGSGLIDDFIVRDPVTAELWQPIGVVRQAMLHNSFSCLPIRYAGEWRLITDAAVARLLRGVGNDGERKARLTLTVADAVEGHGLTLSEAAKVKVGTALVDVLAIGGWHIVLVVGDDDRLIGMATPFDLL